MENGVERSRAGGEGSYEEAAAACQAGKESGLNKGNDSGD